MAGSSARGGDQRSEPGSIAIVCPDARYEGEREGHDEPNCKAESTSHCVAVLLCAPVVRDGPGTLSHERHRRVVERGNPMVDTTSWRDGFRGVTRRFMGVAKARRGQRDALWPAATGRMSPVPRLTRASTIRAMDTLPHVSLPPTAIDELALSRRRFLRNAALTGGGLVAAAGLAACAPAGSAAGWTFGPDLAAASAAPEAGASPSASAAASHTCIRSPAASASAGPGRPDAGRLERTRRRGPGRRPPLHREPRAGACRHLSGAGLHQARRDPRRRGRLPRARGQAGLRPGARSSSSATP